MGSCLHFQNFCLFEFKHAIFNCSSRKHIRTFFLNATAENIFILHVAECWMVQQKLNRGVVFGKKIISLAAGLLHLVLQLSFLPTEYILRYVYII